MGLTSVHGRLGFDGSWKLGQARSDWIWVSEHLATGVTTDSELRLFVEDFEKHGRVPGDMMSRLGKN
jgi:hypothetical protein